MFCGISYIKNIAAILTGCFFLWGCENNIADIQAFNSNAVGKDTATKVVIRYSIGGKKKAILTAPVMFRTQSPESFTEFPKTVHVDFYNEKGDSIESRLDARYAKYRDVESIVFLKDSIKVQNTLGDTLYCHELYWDRSKRGHEFYTDKAVRIRTKKQIIDGIGMDARQDFKEWHIVKPVGFLKVPSSEFPE